MLKEIGSAVKIVNKVTYTVKDGHLEGLCPKCKEHTEISWQDSGCCNAGVINGSGIWTSDDMEKPDSYYEAKAGNDRLDVYRGK